VIRPLRWHVGPLQAHIPMRRRRYKCNDLTALLRNTGFAIIEVADQKVRHKTLWDLESLTRWPHIFNVHMVVLW
jgi:hypothetical protein